MYLYWPLILLMPALVMTAFNGRSAWVWLVTSLGAGIVSAVEFYVFWAVQQEQPVTYLAGLLTPVQSVNVGLREFQFLTRNISGLSALVLPGLIVGLLLLLRTHPRRHWLDLSLFWVTVALVFAASQMVNIFWRFGPPRRYVDSLDVMFIAKTATQGAFLLALGVAIFAATRPIRSWWPTRGGQPDAL